MKMERSYRQRAQERWILLFTVGCFLLAGGILLLHRPARPITPLVSVPNLAHTSMFAADRILGTPIKANKEEGEDVRTYAIRDGITLEIVFHTDQAEQFLLDFSNSPLSPESPEHAVGLAGVDTNQLQKVTETPVTTGWHGRIGSLNFVRALCTRDSDGRWVIASVRVE